VFATLLLILTGLYAAGRLAAYTLRVVPRMCLFFPPGWCFRAHGDRYRWTLGIPNAFWGVTFYLALIIPLLLGIYSASEIVGKLFPMLIVAGFASSLYFMYVQFRILREFCFWCTLSATVMTFLFILNVFAR